jgi:protein KTI12
MPLIIVAGRPCVGKSRFSEQLRDFLQTQSSWPVVLVNEESLRLSKKDGYSNSNKEKDIRGALKSAAEHSLSPNTFVILDSLNYIKGYRYELYCQARTMRSTHCVVWVGCDEDTAIARNEERRTQGLDCYDAHM